MKPNERFLVTVGLLASAAAAGAGIVTAAVPQVLKQTTALATIIDELPSARIAEAFASKLVSSIVSSVQPSVRPGGCDDTWCQWGYGFF